MIFDTKRHPQTKLLVKKAALELSRADPVLADVIRRVGPCELTLRRRRQYFASLVESIIFQQLTGKAAGSILAHFRSLYPPGRFPTPAEVWGTPERQLRDAGLSSMKVAYLKDLSHRIGDGSFPLRRVSAMEDEEVIRHLTQVKGIGQWTAEMFLIFTLGRADVLPLGDLGIRKAVQRNYGMNLLPSPRSLERLGEKWRPYRSVASWYLWASVDGND